MKTKEEVIQKLVREAYHTYMGGADVYINQSNVEMASFIFGEDLLPAVKAEFQNYVQREFNRIRQGREKTVDE